MGADIAGSPEQVRQAACAAFLHHDWELQVLDLCFDSVVDAPPVPASTGRTLLFTRDGCRVRADVHGIDRLTIDVAADPGGDTSVTALTYAACGTTTVATVDHHGLSTLRPGLTTLVVRWVGGEHVPVRTAWVLL